jgi:hypothetical protein
MPGPGIPSITWGTFKDVHHVPHIAPVIEGRLMPGHKLSPMCKCGPTIERSPHVMIVIHHVIH